VSTGDGECLGLRSLRELKRLYILLNEHAIGGHYRSAAQAKPEHSAEGQSKPGLAKKESVFLT